MRFILILMIELLILPNYVCAGLEDLKKEDIEEVTDKIVRSFRIAHNPNSIYEQGIPVGECSSHREKFYTIYRPSIETEIFKCTDRSLYSLEEAKLPVSGSGHAGLTSCFSQEEVNEGVIKPFLEYRRRNGLGAEHIKLFVGGFSAGAHRAVQTALYLKQHDDTKNCNIILLRFAGAKSFDDLAVGCIHSFLGEDNIIEFHAEGDSIAEYLDLPGVESVLGHRISFSAEDSEAYNTRVRNKAFTNIDRNLKSAAAILDNPLLHSLAQGIVSSLGFGNEVVDFLKPDIWERHQPITYRELCPSAFEKFKNLRDNSNIE